jgi:RHS repeat-associated protein
LIVSEKRNASAAQVLTYEYDKLGQMVRANDPVAGNTWTYQYDRGGNMLERKTYAYTADSLDEAEVLNTDTYSYGDAGWKDKLTAYNGQDIVYDAIGNPLDDGTWTYQWQRGRLLTQMQSDEHTVSYVYDHNGMRVKKIVDGVATEYLLRGSQIIHMTRGDTQLHFYYDAQGKPCVATYGGADYYYLYNLQGDVIGLADSAKKVVVEYTYDPWGKPLTCTGTMAVTLGTDNTFRFRAYVWDGETGVYYLNARYYNPELRRFSNSDRLLTGNLFSYCMNAPTMRTDSTGNFSIGALISTVVAVAKTVINAIVKAVSVQTKKKVITQEIVNGAKIGDKEAAVLVLGSGGIDDDWLNRNLGAPYGAGGKKLDCQKVARYVTKNSNGSVS